MTPPCAAVCSWRPQLAIATYPCPFLEPFASVGGGAHWPLNPLCPPSLPPAIQCLPLQRAVSHPPRAARCCGRPPWPSHRQQLPFCGRRCAVAQQRLPPPPPQGMHQKERDVRGGPGRS